VVTAIAGPGTAETTWQAWPALRTFPVLPLTEVRHLVVVAPHPDDEVLGAGGTMRLAADAGVRVELLAVTDGEASHPGSTAVTPTQLATIRRGETAAAMTALGLAHQPIHRVGIEDGAVDAAEPALAAAIAARLTSSSWCLATWAGDGHPDHEATGRAAAAACATTGARLLGYPVWTWHWAAPGDSRVPWQVACRVPLPQPVRAAKAAAMTCYTSQLRPLGPRPEDAPVLWPGALARFDRDAEVFFG
jgi:LmbE family N-acetylglucosaminyl deacetylase